MPTLPPAFLTPKNFQNKSNGSAQIGATDTSEKWRTLAAWATVLLRAANQSKPPDGLARYADILRCKILCKNSWELADKEAMKKLLDVTDMFNGQRLRDSECLAYLLQVATANAQKIEGQVQQERNRNIPLMRGSCYSSFSLIPLIK